MTHISSLPPLSEYTYMHKTGRMVRFGSDEHSPAGYYDWDGREYTSTTPTVTKDELIENTDWFPINLCGGVVCKCDQVAFCPMHGVYTLADGTKTPHRPR